MRVYLYNEILFGGIKKEAAVCELVTKAHARTF